MLALQRGLPAIAEICEEVVNLSLLSLQQEKAWQLNINGYWCYTHKRNVFAGQTFIANLKRQVPETEAFAYLGLKPSDAM